MHKITGKQCKMARSLLKWNLYDLGSRLRGVPPKRVDSFERGLAHIQEWENDEIVKVLKKEGIQFKSDFEVALGNATGKQAGDKRVAVGEGGRIVLDADQSVLFDSSAIPGAPHSLPLPTRLKEEKENQPEEKE